ncbi:hypothetical protein ZWY2020_035972 [Hordeum vulgare]|nr:hypothetical protein ZWY2020_035972 [Hordeum vulgare]
MPPAPELSMDLVEQILIRLPPDDPGCLFRASLVCRLWRGLLTSADFARRYREFHRTPPLLGFFENHDTVKPWFAPSSPAASPFPPLFPDRRDLYVLDSRHALVLLRNPIRTDDNDHAVSLIVWDPVGRRQWEFPPPDFASTVIYDVGVVVCAADHCDHLGCHGSSFLVGYVGTDYSSAYASVFSLETSSWSPTVSCPHPGIEIWRCQPKPLVGNAAYSICVSEDEEYGVSQLVLRFDLFSRELSKFDGPPIHRHSHYVLMKTEEGVLGCATMQGSRSRLHLWSTETGPDGAVAWMQPRVVHLNSSFFGVVCFEDRAGAFYLTTDDGVTTVDLKSGRVKKTSIDNSSTIPYISFYTPDQAVQNVEVAQGGRWKQVGDKEKEADEKEEQEEEKALKELFTKGSKALKDEDFISAVDCRRTILEIRVARHGKISPKCCSAYFNYGWALLRKILSNRDSVNSTTTQRNTGRKISEDLDLAWKMLHVARAISAKIPASTIEKYKIYAVLAKVSVERALANLEHLLEPDHRRVINLNLHIRFAFELQSKIGDSKAILLCMSRVENLKRARQALLADKGNDISATEVGSENTFPPKLIEFFTNKILSALEEKLEDPGASNTRVSEASAGADHEAAGRIVKRAKLKQTSVEDDSSDSSDGDTEGYDDSDGSDVNSDGSDGDGDSDGSAPE